jgi:D-beta-D-heptose 7-phosphate kinase/D-beta-D-heptose 1-phosphate adenosyltransferase
VSAADPRRKIFTWADGVAWRRQQRGRVVFTNGVFDLLHPGHIDILRGARAHGDVLVVGLNTDASVRRLKGPERPIRPEADRAYVLAALEAVDAVVLFDQDTPLELVRTLEPDVIAKGGDYAPDDIVGADVVRARGGDVVVVPLTAGHSTTSIIQRMTQDPTNARS